MVLVGVVGVVVLVGVTVVGGFTTVVVVTGLVVVVVRVAAMLVAGVSHCTMMHLFCTDVFRDFKLVTTLSKAALFAVNKVRYVAA